MNSTSVSLLQRLRDPQRDAEAWQRFVELYAPLIFHWGRQLNLQDDDAADLVQEVLALTVVKLPELDYDPSKRFRGWLRTVAKNKANDIHRRAKTRPRTGKEETLAVATASEADLFDEREYRRFLARRALMLMKSEFREEVWQACWKHVVEGLKAAQVAQELGITVNMVYLAKSRVLSRLREEMKGLMD